jgi:hypothetical protein
MVVAHVEPIHRSEDILNRAEAEKADFLRRDDCNGGWRFAGRLRVFGHAADGLIQERIKLDISARSA